MPLATEQRQPGVAVERWIKATYCVRASPTTIEARARSIALEQSVELPLAAVHDSRVLREVVARVAGIEGSGIDVFRVTIEPAAETTGFEPGQLMNMLFGNTSLQQDVDLVDIDLPPGFV